MEFDGKVAMVTGAGGKLGRAIALGLAAGGADLLISDLEQEQLDEAVSYLQDNGARRVETLASDLSEPQNCAAVVEAAVKMTGRLDIVVNNAGLMAFSTLDVMKPADWDRIFAVNVRAPYFIAQAAMPHLLKSHGNVVNVCSTSAFRGLPYMTAYGASKAALVSATESLTMEFIHDPVRLNCVAPGATNTDMSSNLSFPDAGRGIDQDLFARMTPLRRYSEPEEIVEVVLFLASERASAIRGACFTADQGQLAG